MRRPSKEIIRRITALRARNGKMSRKKWWKEVVGDKFLVT